MTWEQKTEMCTLLNSGEYGKAADLIIENADTADAQAWDMFYTGLELTKESLSKDIEKHLVIRERNKDMKFDYMRIAIRVSAYEMIVDELKQEQQDDGNQ